MGRTLATRAITLMPADLDPRFKDLTATSARVLVTMAILAHDTGSATVPAGHYFAGWHRLARSLGYPHAEDQSAGQRSVARAIADLRTRGIIRLIGKVEPGQPKSIRVYALDL